MPVEYITDRHGYPMRLYRYEKFPEFLSNASFSHASLEAMQNFKLRPDDILLCSYVKCGCHWLWEVINMLVKGDNSNVELEKESSMMEFDGINGDIPSQPSPRVLNNHQFFENQPRNLLQVPIRLVFVYRNPKDVAVSFYHHVKKLHVAYEYDGDFSAFVERFVEGNVENNCIFDYLRSWEKGLQNNPNIDVIVMSYEDMKDDPTAQTQRLAEFLGLKYSEDFIHKVVEATSFAKMSNIKTRKMMYRKGEVGDWKNYFTVAQNAWFDEVMASKMKGSSMFEFKYEL